MSSSDSDLPISQAFECNTSEEDSDEMELDSDLDVESENDFDDSSEKGSTSKKDKSSKPKSVPRKKKANASESKKENDEEGVFDDSNDEKSTAASKQSRNSKKRSRSKVSKIDDEDVESKVEEIMGKQKKAPKKIKVFTPIQLMDRAVQSYKWWEHPHRDNDIYFTTVLHNGLIFQPPYRAHGVPLYYDGKPVELTAEQEEIATLYAMVGEDAIQLRDPETAKIFNANFFEAFRSELGEGSVVKDLQKCDFSKIREYLEEKRKLKVKATAEEKQEIQMRYGYMIIDGNLQKAGNYTVEPPSLFRGRGLHPKAGCVKMRVLPEQVSLNMDPSMPVPACPLPGHNWGDLLVRHESSFIAQWEDNVKEANKYVGVSNTSYLKGEHDMSKYETARRLKGSIKSIRADVFVRLRSTSMRERQHATAIWIIDKLALRVGNEKTEEEADTVGCCSLRVEHLSFQDPYILTLDFVAKDSMPYHQTVALSKYEGGKQVFKNLQLFCKEKKATDEVFDFLTTSSLNSKLSSYMPGLTAKVFRTYNASITLQKQLMPTYPDGTSVDEKVTQYNDANREVAILCNHQRTLPKNWDENIQKKEYAMKEVERKLDELKDMLEDVKKGKDIELYPEMYKQPLAKVDRNDYKTDEEYEREKEKYTAAKEKRDKFNHLFKTYPNASAVEKRIETFEEKVVKMRLMLKNLNANKMVALGTSKINYMDPRITVAWCKRNEVPIEKIFTASIRNRHNWAMCAKESYSF